MSKSGASTLRDYSADSRMIVVSVLAAGLGAVCAVLAWVLIRLIGLATNLFYFHRWAFVEVEPADAPMHWWSIFIPVVGGLMVGAIARYGAKNIRGHGMPEAVEAVVFGGAKVDPKVAVLKPVATAISIGSGGPFGAEGPVIASGGAVGSVLGQLLPLTDAERSVMLVAGAAAGMAAAFYCPLSAVLLAVELLLFEWRPRSLVPVTMACVTAAAVRRLLLGAAPIFAMPPTTVVMHHQALVGALAVGVVMAFLAIGLNTAIHWCEAQWEKLPIHWMWYPALGGLIVGVGGYFFPRALGVGYGTITDFVNQDWTWTLVLGVLTVKVVIWVGSLSSNTAGGILAPLLMIGAASGAAMGHWLPWISPGAWAAVGMVSLLAASIGAPLTSAMLAVELTHNGGLTLPVLLACMTAYALSALLQPRSMLTAGLSRKGKHLSREYGVDPLEMVTVGEVMSLVEGPLDAPEMSIGEGETLKAAAEKMALSEAEVIPVVDVAGNVVGLLRMMDLLKARAKSAQREGDRERVIRMKWPLGR
ncbi:chloride channel protein [Terriglobus tenax]|uniref:chloride channel protein n=1 Tax=Terriglobus tenax TaxID=1111115 RepID=UPI0021E007FD|nr:chloride channel protein [Terriglobus tenax]